MVLFDVYENKFHQNRREHKIIFNLLMSVSELQCVECSTNWNPAAGHGSVKFWHQYRLRGEVCPRN